MHRLSTLYVFIAFGLSFLFLAFSPKASAFFESHYIGQRDLTFAVTQRAQEELAYTAGFLITDLEVAGLATEQFELGLKLRFLTNYGPVSVVNFATSGSGGNYSFRGMDRPIIRARQLIYGSFDNGRWYIVELGVGLFNVSGFTDEYYRYWSSRIALHEALRGKYFDHYFELGASVRSLTEFAQPSNTGLIFPPTVDALIGIEKNIKKTGMHFATDFKVEQALTDTTTAGSYTTGVVKPYGGSTKAIWGAECGYKFNPGEGVFFRMADRIYRWPDDDNASLWSTFEEGSLGRSYALQWRGEW